MPDRPKQSRGIALNKGYASGGDSLGNAMHTRRTAQVGTKKNPTGMHTVGSTPPRAPLRRKRGSKPASKALPQTPAMGKSGGSLGGQSVGKIV